MTYQVVQGDARRIPLADGSVHCCVTSPPYYGLRSYLSDDDPNKPSELGTEETPAEYVARMVEAFREVRRVLRDDATCWINLGDSYNSGSGGYDDKYQGGFVGREDIKSKVLKAKGRADARLAPKQLLGIPWRVAFALQADGWYLRSDIIEEVELYCHCGCGHVMQERIWRHAPDRDIIWSKPNPMPESVTDRPTKAHEYVFLLAKAEKYYYDADAVQEPAVPQQRTGRKGHLCPSDIALRATGMRHRDRGSSGLNGPTGDHRNLRTVWTIATRPYKGAHFAVMPPALVRPCILAGTSERGCCPTCGAPWRRLVEKGESDYQRLGSHNGKDFGRGDSQPGGAGQTRTANGTVPSLKAATSRTLGWEPSCSCPSHDPQPCTVLDPFGGAMTTLVAAEALGRRGVGVELSRLHCARGKRRLDRPHARPEPPADTDEPLPLFA